MAVDKLKSGGVASNGKDKALSEGEHEAWRKWVVANKGDLTKCRSKVEAFQSSSPIIQRELGTLKAPEGFIY